MCAGAYSAQLVTFRSPTVQRERKAGGDVIWIIFTKNLTGLRGDHETPRNNQNDDKPVR